MQLARVAAKEGASRPHPRQQRSTGRRDHSAVAHGALLPDLVAQTGSEEAAFAAMAGMATPLGRYATADEVAGQISGCSPTVARP